MKLAFVEQKVPDLVRIEALLKLSAAENQWANRGPVYRLMADHFRSYLNVPDGCDIVPVSNGGVALEVMARLHAARAGRNLRWVGSAYSFQNLGRGYFKDVRFCDCDEGGLLDLKHLEALDRDSYDGIILTNPFGLYTDFKAFSDFAARAGKVLLLDNASGVFKKIPDLEWQAFSLHHTKPFGMGEGGLALVPKEAADALYALVDYRPSIPDDVRAYWFQNGKISDLSCAFILDRLQNVDDWGQRNLAQRERVIRLAGDVGLAPLHHPTSDIPMTSMPFLRKTPLPLRVIEQTRYATCSKYYHPLADLPVVKDIYARLVNIPCHGDMAQLSDEQLREDVFHLGSDQRPVNTAVA